MIPYKNMNLLSPIVSYDFGVDWIRVEWFEGETRTYRYSDTGKRNINRMIKCAKTGRGLATYIESNRDKFKPDSKKFWGFKFF